VEIRSLLNYDFTSGQCNSPSVRGCLSLCYHQWVKLGTSGFILSVVRDGYKIPFVTLPPPKVSPNNHSAVTHSHFVSEAISDLLRTKYLSILTHQIMLVVLLLKMSIRFFIKIGVLQRVLKALLGESLGLVVSIVHNSSRVEELQSLALPIFHVCTSSGISREMRWIPRDSNHQADSLSRIIDFDDYS
ncbi:unnamed protein product, partial [Porites lobata]